MAVSVTDEFEIEATPEQVMAALSAVERLPEWSPAHKAIDIETRYDDGRPRRVRQTLSLFGLSDEQVVEHTWRGNEMMSWTLLNSSMQKSQEGRYELSASAKGTKVTTAMSVDPKISIPTVLLERGQRRAMDAVRTRLTEFILANYT